MSEPHLKGDPPPSEAPPSRQLPWPARIGPILHGLGVVWVIAGVASTQLGPLGGLLSLMTDTAGNRKGAQN